MPVSGLTCANDSLTTSVSAVMAGRFQDLARTLIRNAEFAAGAPTRAAVYSDVAAQLWLLAEDVQARTNPLVVELSETEVEVAVARRFEQLAGQLAANARTLTTSTTDAEMLRRSAIYRDVASQVRRWAAPEVELAEVRVLPVRRTARRVLHPVRRGLHAGIAELAAQFYLDASTGLPVIRAAFMEPLVDAIAKRHRAGWSVARLSLWLNKALTDPQTGEVYLPGRAFVAYVTGLLTGARTASRAA